MQLNTREHTHARPDAYLRRLLALGIWCRVSAVLLRICCLKIDGSSNCCCSCSESAAAVALYLLLLLQSIWCCSVSAVLLLQSSNSRYTLGEDCNELRQAATSCLMA